ncbi:StAR-related lipid transfer protein 9 [Manis javanica]|nr:StAR-related lipid transfer protein 9 [Manis javanica]
MANVRVALRVRPLSKRENKEGGKIIVEVDGTVAKIKNLKVDSRPDGFGDSREKVVAFGFDYCYWSVNPEDPQYASQDVVFRDLGTEVLSGAAKGYNICLFAYGQTGSGKTYTMLGTPASVGLTPRICEGLFIREEDYPPLPSSCRIKVSFLEIYNERVRDLLKRSDQKKSYTLRVREHPEMGPYVQGLSQHVVTNYKQVIQLLEEGIANRITAATHVHEASSRSHAIFMIHYTQAILENNLPSEIASKINLVDLAGSERADPSYGKDRIAEGASINRSLVTLGIVISALAQNSQVFSSCHSLSSTASDGGDGGIPCSPGTSSGGRPFQRQSYIPYRDSVLTWLLKDSLGGNSKTIMVATVSPAHTSYSETMSTLRYASSAKNIINKPQVNEDANVKLIRELRAEIGRLKAMLLSFELRSFSPLNEEKDENLKELVLQNELKIDQLTKDWTRKWNEWKALVEHYRVDINRRRAGVVIDSSLPHLTALEDDVLSTGVVLYYLKEGTTKIGRIDSDQEQDIVLQGQWIERDHCTITSACGVVVLRPTRGARCTVNGREVTASCRLTQGAVITLGKAQTFRFNHPAEAAVLRQRRQVTEAGQDGGSLEWLDLDGDATASRLGLCPLLWKERRVLEEQSDEGHQPLRTVELRHRARIQQQCYVGNSRQRILAGQIRAKQELEFDQARIRRQIKDNQQWLLGGETWPAGLEQQQQQDCVAGEEPEASGLAGTWPQTHPETRLPQLVRGQKRRLPLQLQRRDALRAAEWNIRQKKLSFQLERIIRKQRLLEAQKRLEPLEASCWPQGDCAQKLPYQIPCSDALVPGPQCRSKSTSCSSLSLQRLCGQYLPQLRSIFLNWDPCTTLPPVPDSADQVAEETAAEEYLPQTAAHPPRTGHFSKNALRSGKGQLCTTRGALAVKRASALCTCLPVSSQSASIQEMERVALTELLRAEDPQGMEQDLPEPENSESDDSQVSEDALAEKGCRRPRDSLGGTYLANGHSPLRAGAGASVRGSTTSSDSGLFTRIHRRFSLDSLVDAEEELGEDQQEELFFSSADEMPTETFWRLQTSSLPIVDQTAMCSLDPIIRRIGARLEAILPMSSSFYLAPKPWPHCEQSEVEAGASSSEQADTPRGTQVPGGSPLLSTGSSFSCDSKINPSSPPGIAGSLCPSPGIQEFQPCGWEKPGYWLNMEEQKSPEAETVLSYISKLPQGGAELPCRVRSVYTMPASETSRLSLWGSYRLLQPGADGTFQARGTPDQAQQDSATASDSSSVSHVVATSATSPTHVHSACDRDWAALQQRYLLELSPVWEATGESMPGFPSLEEDSGALTQASGKGGDSLLPFGSVASSSVNFKNFPIHLSKVRHVKAEKEQDIANAELEGISDLFTTSEKEVSYSGTYSADIESSSSETTNVQVFAAEDKIENSMMEACEVKQNNLGESSQSRGKPGLTTSSDECFLPKNPCDSYVTIAAKDGFWPQGQAPLRKGSAGQVGKLSHKSHHPQQEGKEDSQESFQEVVGRHTDVSFAFSSGSELPPDSAPWDPFPYSLQPPPLGTFYVTKSRDVLTETALEISACREARAPSPPPQEAWCLSCDPQVLQNVYLKNNLPVLLENQNSNIALSQQVTAERPVDLNTKEISGGIGKCPGNVEEESHNSVYFSVAQKRHFLPSTSIKVYDFENQFGILNKHSLPVCAEGKGATVPSYCGVPSSRTGSREPLFVCESEAGRKEERDQNAVQRQSQAFDTNRQFPSGSRSDFIYKTIHLGLDKDMRRETAAPLKSKSVCHRASSLDILAIRHLAHNGEGKNETGLLGKAHHPKDSSEEFKLPSTYGRFQSVTCCQERNLSECRGPGKSQEMLKPKREPSGKKQNKQINHTDEMARLVRSVMQLENSILEIKSKQNSQLYASYTLGVSKEFMFQDQKDQEMADHVLQTGSSENHLSPKDQPSFPRQTDDVTHRDSEAREMEAISSIGKNPQVQKTTLNPFKSKECVPDVKFVRAHTHLAVLDRSARDTCDYLGPCTVHRESTNTSFNPRRTKALARTQPTPEKSSEKEGELMSTSASPRGQPCGLGSLELETVKGFQESQAAKSTSSSKQEEPNVQGGVEEMAVQRGRRLQKENKVVSSTQKLPSPSQCCMGTLSSQETGALLSQPDSSTAPPQDRSNTLPLNSPRLSGNYLHVPSAIGISSVDCGLDPTKFKVANSLLGLEAWCQDQSREPGHHGSQENVRGASSVAHPAWGGSAISMAMGSYGQPWVPEVGAEGRTSASTRPQNKGRDLRSNLVGLSPRVGSASEAGAAVQGGMRQASSLNRVSSLLEKWASCPLGEGNNQGRKERQTEKEAEDPSPASSSFSVPGSLPRGPPSEPAVPAGLAVLEEVRQAEAQGRRPHSLLPGSTVLPYYETLSEHDCSSGAPGRPLRQQVDQSVSDRTTSESETQGFHVASLSAEPGHQLTDERKVLQATPLSADNFQSLPNAETKTRLWHPSQTSSHAAPALGKSHCHGQLRHLLGTGEQFICHSSSCEMIEKMKEATRTPSSADPLCTDNLPSSTAVEEKMVVVLPSQAPPDDAGAVPCRQSQLAPWDAAEGMPLGHQESIPARWEPGTLDTTCGGDSGNFLEAQQGGKTTSFEGQHVSCVVQGSASLSRPNQDHVQSLEVSTGLEEGRASRKQSAGLPGALGRVELEAPSWKCVKWKASVGLELADAYGPGSKHPGPSAPLDQSPPSGPGGVKQETRYRRSQGTMDCVVFSGHTEGSGTLRPPAGQEDSRTLSCRQLHDAPPVASHACSSPLSTSLSYRDGDLGKGTSRAVPHTLSLPCVVRPRGCGMDESAASSFREPDVLLARGLEHKGINVEFGPTDSTALEPSVTAAVLALAQGSSPPSAPDEKTGSLSDSADGSSRSVGDPEKKVAEKKVGRELEAANMYSEPLRLFQDSSEGGQNVHRCQTKPELPLTTGQLHTLNLSEGSVQSELLAEPWHRCSGNTVKCHLKKPQLSTYSSDHSGLDPQATFVTKLKHIPSPQVGGHWEEEQQRNQTSGAGKGPAQGRDLQPSGGGGLDGCQIGDVGRDEVAAANSPVSKTFSSAFRDSATVLLGQSAALQPTAHSPGQPAPHRRSSLPAIAVSSPEHSRSSPRPQFSGVSSSRSLQELNLSVEPPSPTDEDIQEPNRLWSPHPRGSSSGKSEVRPSLQAEGCSQEASSYLDNSTADHRPLHPTTPPYPTSSALSCMPTPDFPTSWMSDTREQAWQETPERLGGQARPEKWQSQVDKGVLLFGCSGINPYARPWQPEGPARIGWKQYVFGSAVDTSCSQTLQGLIPSNVTRCSSVDNCLEDQNSPFHSHLSTYANTQGLSSTHSSIESAQGSQEAWEVWDSPFALGNPRILTGLEGTAPTKGPDKRAQFPGAPGEAGCPRCEPPLAEECAAGPVDDEIMLLYPSEAGSLEGQCRRSTLEQGTQTLGCSLHWSYTNISLAQLEASAMPVCDLASWTSMHNLSLHLSQLLHSTLELLGSLSQPGVAGKEQNAKRETPCEAPQALMIDSCTQTTVDEVIQTDLASPPLPLQDPKANPQEVSAILEELGSNVSTMSQEQGHVSGMLQKKEAEETAWEMAGPPDLQEESTPCRPQSPAGPSSHLKFLRDPFGKNLPAEGPLSPHSQPEEPSCLSVSLSNPHCPEPCPSAVGSIRKLRVQKEPGPMSALVVDRASSPILTLSASTQRLWYPSDHPLEGHQKLVSISDLSLDVPRSSMDNYSQTPDEPGGSQGVGAPCGEGTSPLERSDGRSFLEVSSLGSPQQSPTLQVHFLEQPPQQLQPRASAWMQSRLPPPPPMSRSQRLADGSVPKGVASLGLGPQSSRGLSHWQSRTEDGDESAVSPVELQPTVDLSSSWGGCQCPRPCPVSDLSDTVGLQASTSGPTAACQPEGMLCRSSQTCMAPEPQHHSLRDLPVHNKFSNWCGVQDDPPGGLGVVELLRTRRDLRSVEQKPSQPPDNQSQDPEWSPREQVPLQVGPQHLSLSVELTEAKLHRGFGKADALLQVLQSGTGEALGAHEPAQPTSEELFGRQKQTIEILWKERAERLKSFHGTRSLSLQKQPGLLSGRGLPTRDLDLPSRRREYLQQLRKDVVETTRNPGPALRSARPPSDIELMLQEYQQAREEAKVEIAQARDRLREQTEQEKLRIHQQIISQLLKEEEKLHTLATSSSLCTSSSGSLSSGVTSGYSSSQAWPSQHQCLDNGNMHLPDSRDSWIGDVQDRSAVRNSHLILAGSSWKSLAYSHRASLSSCCCSPSSQSSMGTCFSSYQNLAKHVVDNAMADVMAACSDNLHNLFSHQAAAGWNYQGKEQEVQLYYKTFSSTRHGFLGAGMVSQPLSHVWAAVSDPTLWPLYHKPIQTARLHQRVTKNINLVYLVCNTALCALKQPRDFCCVCVEAKEGHLSVMAAQSVYDIFMPRPSREMIRGEILPSAWILQPLTVEGKETTRVIYLAQVELGAPGFPPQLLSSFIKQQPLVIARLASFLGS